jgi:antitoxin component YwqK of YwqJK toxin-antitoxin module
MNLRPTFPLLLLSTFSAACMAGSTTEAPDSLLADEVPSQVSKSSTGDFFVDSKTEIGWSTRVSVELDYSEAHFYCASLGYGWRLPTIGELETMTHGVGKKRTIRKSFRKGLPADGLLFSSEEIPVIDDEKQPLVMRIKNGSTLNGHGREGYVRCAHGPATRKRTAHREPSPMQLGERWWEKSNACAATSIARGTPGLEVSCRNKQGARQGRSTTWPKDGRRDSNYQGDKLHGKVTHWRADGGKSAIVSYREGKLHGHSTHWYPSGIKASDSVFAGGLLSGTQQRWDENGQLQVRTRFRRGRIVEQLYYDSEKPRDGAIEQKHANGVDSYIGVFKKGRALGQHYGYHENGKLRFKRLYNKKGVPHGASGDWHVNGQPHEVSTFENGALQGERVFFNGKGKTLKRDYYDNGVLVSK